MDIPRKNNINDQKEISTYQKISEADSKIYDFLNRNFDKENTNSFSLGFSKNIIRKIEARQKRRLNVKLYSLVAILVLISIPLFMSFLNNEIISMIYTVFLQYKFIFSFLICGVILIQYSERLIDIKKDTK